MKLVLTFLIILCTNLTFGQTKYEKDFSEFWNDIHDNYAYFDQQPFHWEKVKAIYQPQVKEIGNDKDFIRLMEKVVHEFHNGHISLNTNLSTSNRMIPAGQDLFVQKRNDKFYITDIRKGFGADLSGLKMGDEVVLFNGKKIPEQMKPFLPNYTTIHTEAMEQYAINMLFAGTHIVKRAITIHQNGNPIHFYPDSFQRNKTVSLIDTKILNKTTAYLKINNALGDFKTIEAFDKAIDEFLQYKNLVIDLTETPNGGNTTVARSLLGRFVTKAMPYQQHELDEIAFQTKRMWVEYVIPRKTPFKGKVFVIVGHWTGSMGEGIAIGFDGLKKAKIIGTEMAKLLGAVDRFTMSETKIGFQFPTERLYHINGTPREKYKPTILTNNMEETFQRMNEIK
jgi:C-terminal processing protease CtpA/Prc